jgi:peptidoglycan/LPS O-acetylase OafA/YrhL
MRIPMPLIVFVAGLLLTALGLLAYFAFAPADERSWTAFIPAIWGVPIMGCAIVSLFTRKLRKHAMHIVAVLALLGVIAPLGRFFSQMGKPDFEFGAAAITILLMALICVVLLFFTIVSFINARRERKAASKLMDKAAG